MVSAQQISDDRYMKETSLLSVGIFSLIFHIMVFFVIPVITRLAWREKKYVRPKTFQLVQIPQNLEKSSLVETKKQVRKKKKHKRVVPKTKKDNIPTKPTEQEELDELENLFEKMPEPVSNINFAKAFPYSWYERNIMNQVEQNWKPPFKDENISVLVSFSIYGNGSISEVKLKRSSGNPMLDNLAIRAVKLAAPFGKLPPGYSGNELRIDYTLKPTVR